MPEPLLSAKGLAERAEEEREEMGSYNEGKPEVVRWVKDHFPKGSTCLDVGACDGKWWYLLGDYLKMDAVEIFQPNIAMHDLKRKYNKVFYGDICGMEYGHYDLIIFGDVLEHMTVEKAQKVLKYAEPRCKDMVIGIPFLYSQDEIYGNPWEKHIQNDLTPELFDERYPGYEVIVRPLNEYCYYHKGERK